MKKAMPDEKQPGNENASEEKALRKVASLFSAIKKDNGTLPSDASALSQDFWKNFWDKRRLSGEIPQTAITRTASEYYASLFPLSKDNPTLKKFRNFFCISPDHPPLTQQDIAAILEGKPTSWQKDQARTTKTRDAGTRRRPVDEKTDTNTEKLKEKYRKGAKEDWKKYWIELTKNYSIFEDVDRVRQLILMHGLLMIAEKALQNVPVPIIPIFGDELIYNLLETPITSLKTPYKKRLNSILAAPGTTEENVNARINETIFLTIFGYYLKNQSKENMDKVNKVKRILTATFSEHFKTSYQNGNAETRNLLFQYINGGYDKYVKKKIRTSQT